MLIHIVQKDINNLSLENFIEKGNNEKADLVCFGELSTSGCLYLPREVDTLESITNNFRQPLAVLFGAPLKLNGKLYNTYVYYKNGETQIYKKINLFPPMNEDKTYRKGHVPGMFETEFGRFGAAICYDIRFPEIFTNLKNLSPNIIFNPAAFPRVRINEWKELLIQRAIETETTIVGINSIGGDGNNEFGGSSMVVDKAGEILAQADESSETVLKVNL
jgi:predicted amidohydrolase